MPMMSPPKDATGYFLIHGPNGQTTLEYPRLGFTYPNDEVSLYPYVQGAYVAGMLRIVKAKGIPEVPAPFTDFPND